MASNGALGRLNIALGVDAAEFTRGMNKAEYQAKNSLDKMARQAKIAAVGIAGIAAVAGGLLVRELLKSAEAMDAMGKRAQGVGVAIKPLQEISYQAEKAGVGMSALDMGFRRVARTAYDAAAGSKSANAAFTAMNINVTDTAGNLRATEDIWRDVSTWFANTEDGTLKAGTGYKLFGTAVTELTPLLNEGAAGIDAAAKKAAELGIVFSQDAATAAAELNDEIFDLKKRLDGYRNQLASQAIPVVNDFIKGLSDTNDAAGDVKKSFDEFTGDPATEEFIRMLAMGFARLVDVAVLLAKTVGTVSLAFRAAAADAEVVVKALNKGQVWNWFDDDASAELSDALTRRNKMVEKFNRALSNLMTYKGDFASEAMEKAWAKRDFEKNFVGPKRPGALSPSIVPPKGNDNDAKSIKARLDSGARLIQQMQERIALIGKETEYERLLAQIGVGTAEFRTQADQDFALSLAQTIDSMDEVKRQAEEYQSLMASLYPERAAADEFIQNVTLLNDALVAGTIDIDQYTDAIARLEAQSNDTFSNMSQFADMAFNSVGNAFADLITSGEADFKSFADNIIREMVRMMTQAMIVKPLMQSLGFGGGGSGGTVDLGIFGTIGNGGWFSGADGGYTGDGGKYEPAGIVHGGEYVMTKEATSRIGVAALNRLNYGRQKGYAHGGPVGMPNNFGGAASNAAPNVQINISDSGVTSKSTLGLEKFGADVARYVDARFKELQARSHRQGGLDWQMRQR